MPRRLPFRCIEPYFFAGLLDDPVLLLKVRPLGRSLLFDCGRIHHLAKRVIRNLDAVFISHAHMDHFMGVDTLVRHVHVSPKTLDLFGPPGIAERLEKKLQGYDWNLAEPYWCRLRVSEVFPDHLRQSLFEGAKGFHRRPLGQLPREDRIIYRNPYMRVEAELCDHRIAVLAFKITEYPAFTPDMAKVRGLNLPTGPWLNVLKKAYHQNALSQTRIQVPTHREDGATVLEYRDAAPLYDAIRTETRCSSVGYLTDVGLTEENSEKISSFFREVTLLISECAFLAEDQEKARASWHLCTDDLNHLLERLRPAFVLPMHLSKSYIQQSHRLYEQLIPPPGTTLLRLPEHLTPRPLLPREVAHLSGFH